MVTHATGAERLLQRWLSSRTRRSAVSPRAVPVLAPGEQLLRIETDDRGRPVAATDRSIYHGDGGRWLRLGWEQVRRVDWDGQRSALLLWGLMPDAPKRTQVML